MTYAAPSTDFFDDGLVHSHQWARNTPPGGKHGDEVRSHKAGHVGHDHDEGLVHEHRWARG